MEIIEKQILDIKNSNSESVQGQSSSTIKKHKISIAPMLNITDNYFRSFIRLLTQNAVLYTEMIHTDTVKNSLRGWEKELAFEENQHPIVIQLGGNDPKSLGAVAQLCKEAGYDEINLNCGCPSSKVQESNFGAMLMEQPELVSECVRSISANSNLETSVKCRLGLNNFDANFLDNFIKIVSEKGNVRHFIVHSRIAIMGLDTVKNRKVPPLQYEKVFDLKRKYKHMGFSLNGGIKTLEEAFDVLNNKDYFGLNFFEKESKNINQKVYNPNFSFTALTNTEEKLIENLNLDFEKTLDLEGQSTSNLHSDLELAGCMIGRAAYEDPWILSNVDKKFYGKKNLGYSKKEVVLKYADFVDKKAQQLNDNIEDLQFHYLRMIKPLHYLFPGERGTTQFKRNLVGIKRNDPNFNVYEHILETFEVFEKRNRSAVAVYPIDNDEI